MGHFHLRQMTYTFIRVYDSLFLPTPFVINNCYQNWRNFFNITLRERERGSVATVETHISRGESSTSWDCHQLPRLLCQLGVRVHCSSFPWTPTPWHSEVNTNKTLQSCYESFYRPPPFSVWTHAITTKYGNEHVRAAWENFGLKQNSEKRERVFLEFDVRAAQLYSEIKTEKTNKRERVFKSLLRLLCTVERSAQRYIKVRFNFTRNNTHKVKDNSIRPWCRY